MGHTNIHHGSSDAASGDGMPEPAELTDEQARELSEQAEAEAAAEKTRLDEVDADAAKSTDPESGADLAPDGAVPAETYVVDDPAGAKDGTTENRSSTPPAKAAPANAAGGRASKPKAS